MPQKTRKLTDTQLVILSAAAQRDDGALLPLPKGLAIAPRALTRTFKALLKKDLVREQPAAADIPAWRETPAGDRFMLVIAPEGLDALGVEPEADAPTPARRNKARSTAGNRKHTPAGRKAKAASSPARAGRKRRDAEPAVQAGTRLALMVDLLRRDRGASIAEIVDATGWQPHSIRGAISGTLKKKRGLTVTSEKTEDRGRVYRIDGHA